MLPKGFEGGIKITDVSITPILAKNHDRLISELRFEYLELSDKLAKLQVALVALAHNPSVSEQARHLLKEQNRAMDRYATVLLARINCAAAEQQNGEAN